MRRILFILMACLILSSLAVNAEIEFHKLKYKTVELRQAKKISFESEAFDNGEVTELSRFIQNRKVELNRRYMDYEPKERYIPDDCDKGYWQNHHIRHYCNWFKVGGKPWKDQETFRNDYLYWGNKFSHQRSR